jgi:hypothetical protein
VKFSAMEMLDVQDRTAIPLEFEGGWAPEQGWAIWRRPQAFVIVGVTTANRPVHSLITIPTELSQLSICISLKFRVTFAFHNLTKRPALCALSFTRTTSFISTKHRANH